MTAATTEPRPLTRSPQQPQRSALGAAVHRVRLALSAIGAGILGLAPHVLHHLGPLAGAALFAGVGGTLLFGAIGLVAAIPFLLRVHRRCGNWRVPAALLATFAAMFSLSAFVIGPAITGDDDAKPAVTAPGGGSGSHRDHH